MKKIYVMVNGIAVQVMNSTRFLFFNWHNFKKGDKVYVNDVYFADFVSYEKSELYDDEVVKLELTTN